MSRIVSRRILAVWLPWWPAERLAGRRPEVRDRPFVAVSDVRGRQVVAAANRWAAQAGLAPGMPLADARAVLPEVVVRLADPGGDACALESLARWAFRFTPRVALGKPDVIFLDVGGCAHLFGGERELAAAVRARLKGFGLTSRAGLAEAPGAAWALARCGEESLGVMPAGAGLAERKKALGGLPVAALRLDDGVADALASFGLNRIRALFDMEPASLAERFGPELPRRLAQALGSIAEPLEPLRPLPPREARRTFAKPVSRAGDVRAAVDELLGELCRTMRKAGEGARRIRLVCHRVDGEPQAVEIGTSRPLRRREPLMRLFAEKLEQVAPGFGVDEMALTAEATEAVVEEQIRWTTMDVPGAGCDDATPPFATERNATAELFGTRRGRVQDGRRRESAEEDARQLAALVDRLGNRFGFDRIARPVPRRSWMPERAVRLCAFDHGETAAAELRNRAAHGTAAARRPFPHRSAVRPPAVGWPAGRPRPVRLISPPEAVQVAMLRDGAPPVSFRRRGGLRWLRSAEGPERLEGEWWREDAPARDYYAVEAEDGRRYWLYRELPLPDGREASGRRAAASRWFLHGVFG